jgi:ketosteroid isomerase-like protein
MSFRDRRNWATPIALAGLILAGCSQPAPRSATDTDLAGITAFNKRYLQSINDGDFATLSRLTTPGHIMMVPGIPAIVGKSANDDANRRSLEQYRVVESWTPAETVIEGGLAFQRGTFSSALTPKAGGATRSIDGKFLRIYRRDADGNWSMYIDMFNGDAPERSQ